ncbi:hypothetical protein GCM10022243_67590 [Saccharothrix violaceirubra]
MTARDPPVCPEVPTTTPAALIADADVVVEPGNPASTVMVVAACADPVPKTVAASAATTTAPIRLYVFIRSPRPLSGSDSA